MEGFWHFGLEKQLSVQSAMNYCGNLEDTAKRSVGDGSRVCEVSEETFESSLLKTLSRPFT